MTEQDQYDKSRAALERLAPVVARYVASLVEAGLTRAEAVYLAAAWQSATIQNSAALAIAEQQMQQRISGGDS